MCTVVLITALFGSPSHAGTPSNFSTFAALLNESPYHHAWQQMLTDEAQVPSWLAQGKAISSPYMRRHSDGRAYIAGSMCKPHDCADNQFWGIFDEHAAHAWGVLITASDASSHVATTHPDMLRFRWFGHPDKATRTALLNLWKTGPQWPNCGMSCSAPQSPRTSPSKPRAACEKLRQTGPLTV
ncbi:Ivy family c-type lysozyme inhibitor [Burkholderia ambifaria]|uniref:Ivy family c-type lysozyme inhibitor n=1 Tax=Burkholderia ambifaria TaxID=152480 RepID=UPI0009DADD09